jgi:uncharacterized repeat protein (TIGR03803 family)
MCSILGRTVLLAAVAFAVVGCFSSNTAPSGATPIQGVQVNGPDAAQGGHAIRRTTSGYLVYHNFTKTSNQGTQPSGALWAGPSGDLFGTTQTYWGSGSNSGGGAVFEVSSNGSPSVQMIYLFDCNSAGQGPDGCYPQTGVVRATDAAADGALYGTTIRGGSGECYSYGCGVLFKLTSQASGTWSIGLHNFAGGTKGAAPSGQPLIDNGTLYGVTSEEEGGTIYKIATDLSGFTILHSFSGGIDSFPSGPLISNSSGELFGTTYQGGDSTCNCGAVYMMKNDGTGFTTIYKFIGVAHGDGAYPEYGVTNVNGTLYGTTSFGGNTGCDVTSGNYGCGVIFKLVPNSSGSYAESILYKFTAAGGGTAQVPSGLVANAGALYGTTTVGGSCGRSAGCGTIFKFATTTNTFSILHEFAGHPDDGYEPIGSPPVFDADGNIWGVTFAGGSAGLGIVYSDASANRAQHRRALH